MISTEEMRKIDRRAQSLGIPAQILMENAGANAARIVNERYGLKNKNILVFAGTGNNGGDGLVFARHAQNTAQMWLYFFQNRLRISGQKKQKQIMLL